MDGQTSLIHPLSHIAPLPQFELWSVPGTQLSVIRDIETEVRPLSTLASDQPIEFVINSANDEYINFAETELVVKARINIRKVSSDVKFGGGLVPELANKQPDKSVKVLDSLEQDKVDPFELEGNEWLHVVPVQNFMHSIFSQVDVKIGDKDITNYPQNYPYRAFIDTLLGYSTTAKNSHLITELWGGKSDRRLWSTPMKTSHLKFKNGDWFEMRGRLHIDFTFQEKNLIGGTEVRIRLIPNDPKFCFICPEGLQAGIEFSQVTLNVHKAKVYPAMVAAHHAAIQNAPTRYPIVRHEVRQQSIPAGQVDAMIDNCIRGQMPRRMFVFLVDNETLNGSFKTDPFKFNHYDLNFIAAYIDGVQYPNRPYTPNFEKLMFTREYKELFNALNQNRTDTYCDIYKTQFNAELPIFAFNFSPDLSSGPGSVGHVSPIQHGSLRLHLKFEKPLPVSVNVMMYCEFDNMIEIDASRQAKTDYN